MPSSTPAISAPGMEPSPPMTMISKPLVVVTTPSWIDHEDRGEQRARESGEPDADAGGDLVEQEHVDACRLGGPPGSGAAARNARPSQVRFSKR